MSKERQETVTDVVAAMRNESHAGDECFLEWVGSKMRSYADRIDAAAKREREATRDKSSQVGNAEKMREALEKVRRVLHCAIVADILKGDDVNGAFNEVIASLSAQPRNCDVGTAEEQTKRFHSFCKKFQSDIQGMCSHLCPCIDCCDMCHCITKWSQMPYKE